MTYIEGDGPKPDIFHLLWKKDSPYLERSNLSIPHTIIFIDGIPTAWYFTNTEGKILRKRNKNMTFENIIKAFTSKSSPNDIVGYFISMSSTKIRENLFKHHKMEDDIFQDSTRTPRSLIEYYTAQGFIKQFSDLNLYKERTGILQSFIKPHGEHNELIQAVWSPQMCIFTKKINCSKITDTKLSVNERVLTFDGPDFLSKTIPLKGKNIPTKLRDFCDSLVAHISNTSYNNSIKIQRMVAYFKMDENEKIYFLWTGSIRTKEDPNDSCRSSSVRKSRPIDLDSRIKPNQSSDSIRRRTARKLKSSKPRKDSQSCVVCDSNEDSGDIFMITWRLLLANQYLIEKSNRLLTRKNKIPLQFLNQYRPSSALSEKTDIQIPGFIRKIFPELLQHEYIELIQQDCFLSQSVNVCEDCFLTATREYEKVLPADVSGRESVPRHSMRPRKRPSTQDSRYVAPSRIRHNESLYEEKSSLNLPESLRLVDKNTSISNLKAPSETALNSSASKSTIFSQRQGRPRLRIPLPSNENSQDLSEKINAQSLLRNQRSSPLRMRNLQISQQFSDFLNYSPQISANVKNNSRTSSRDLSVNTRASVSLSKGRPKSLNQFKNHPNSLISTKSHQMNDFDELLGESAICSLALDEKLQDNQSETPTHSQSVIEKPPRRGSQQLDSSKDGSFLKIANLRLTQNNSVPLKIKREPEAIVKEKENNKSIDQDQANLIQKFYLQPKFQKPLSSKRHLNSSNPRNIINCSLLKEDSFEKMKPGRENMSLSKEKINQSNSSFSVHKDTSQQFFLMDKLYKVGLNLSHRKRVIRKH